MKSAEEWWNSRTRYQMSNRNEVIELIKEVQSDALREAAEIADTYDFSRYETEFNKVRIGIRDAILAKAKELEP